MRLYDDGKAHLHEECSIKVIETKDIHTTREARAIHCVSFNQSNFFRLTRGAQNKIMHNTVNLITQGARKGDSLYSVCRNCHMDRLS